MLEKVCADFPNVSVAGFEGLLTTFCEERGIHTIVKGLRAVSDFDYELQMAQMNSSLVDVETVFIPCSPEYSFLASSLVKEVATYGGDVSGLVPPDVLTLLTAPARRAGGRATEPERRRRLRRRLVFWLTAASAGRLPQVLLVPPRK